MNSATTCRVVCLPNVVYEPRNGTTHPAKPRTRPSFPPVWRGKRMYAVPCGTEEAIYAFSRKVALVTGAQQGWEGDCPGYGREGASGD